MVVLNKHINNNNKIDILCIQVYDHNFTIQLILVERNWQKEVILIVVL